MAIVKAFRGLRPVPDAVKEVASVPYDVIDTKEALELSRDLPLSFLHVIRSEIDLPAGTDLYSQEVYDQARLNFEKLTTSPKFVRDQTPVIYIYRQEMNGRQQTGVMACVSADEYDSGKIKIHEKTREDKENDRTRHLLKLAAHAEPVFLAYRDLSQIDRLVAVETAKPALYDFTANDGIRHTLWKAENSTAISEAFAAVPVTYIADGHHRSASASRARAEMRKNNPQHTGDEEYNYFLAVVFPASQLRIMPYNRLIKSSSHTAAEVIEKLSQHFSVTPNAPAEPQNKGSYSLYLGETWYGLAPKGDLAPATASVVDKLDTSILQDLVLAPIFGIDNPRTSKNIDFVGGIRGTKALEDAVKSGKAFCAFSLFPVSMDELFEVADAGLSLPPKSTWFEPKLRSGLVVHTFQ